MINIHKFENGDVNIHHNSECIFIPSILWKALKNIINIEMLNEWSKELKTRYTPSPHFSYCEPKSEQIVDIYVNRKIEEIQNGN